MFIQSLLDPDQRLFYVSWVITVIFSITLHELAHGLMALRRGDHTPVELGHMTINPLVHMGPFSLAALFFLGIAWGAMPVNPSRLRGKYGEALVALAGPVTNLLLAFLGLTGLGDLVLTSTGDLSRNRRVGIALASGEPLEAIVGRLGHVAEGVACAAAADSLAARLGVEMPIVAAVNAVLQGRLGPREAVVSLLAREPKAEAGDA